MEIRIPVFPYQQSRHTVWLCTTFAFTVLRKTSGQGVKASYEVCTDAL
jgi:hypothetical protein